jgi:ribosome-associated protein
VELKKEIQTIVSAADDKKAFDIKVLEIGGLSSIADYFVVASGNNERQAVAIADEIEDKMTELGLEPLNKEGHQTGRWILLDYGDIIVHVFHKEEREFYNLEKLWLDAKSFEVEDIL